MERKSGKRTRGIEDITKELQELEEGGRGTTGGSVEDSETKATERNGTRTGSGEEADISRENIELPLIIPTPRKNIKRNTPSKKVDSEIKENINLILQLGFGTAETFLGEDWKVSDKEIEGITNPLSKILDKMNYSQSMNKYTDYVMLITGVSIVAIPRLYSTYLKQKEKKENEQKRKNIINNSENRDTTRNIERPKINSDSSTAADLIIQGLPAY